MAKSKSKTPSKQPKPKASAQASAAVSSIRPLKGSLINSLRGYRLIIRGMLVATFWPVLVIASLRYFSDDYTGNQYSAIIGLVSVFTTLLIARIAVAGWDWRKDKLPTMYSLVMSRIISGIGLMLLLIIHALPLVGGLLVLGFGLTGGASVWYSIFGIGLFIVGILVLAMASFSIFAFMEDLSLSVWQSYRVSIRLSRRFWRPLLWRVIAAIGGFILLIVAMVFVGQALAPYLQEPVLGLVFDAFVSWLITPLILYYLGFVFRVLVQAYE